MHTAEYVRQLLLTSDSGVRNIYVHGSRLHGTDAHESDVDLLAKFGTDTVRFGTDMVVDVGNRARENRISGFVSSWNNVAHNMWEISYVSYSEPWPFAYYRVCPLLWFK